MHSPHSPCFFNHSSSSLALRVLAHYPHLLSLLSSLGILSHCPQQMPARASFQKILAAMIWCVCAHSAKTVCAYTNLSRGQSVQTCAKNRVCKLAQRRKLALRTECSNLRRDLQKSWLQWFVGNDSFWIQESVVLKSAHPRVSAQSLRRDLRKSWLLLFVVSWKSAHSRASAQTCAETCKNLGCNDLLEMHRDLPKSWLQWFVGNAQRLAKMICWQCTETCKNLLSRGPTWSVQTWAVGQVWIQILPAPPMSPLCFCPLKSLIPRFFVLRVSAHALHKHSAQTLLRASAHSVHSAQSLWSTLPCTEFLRKLGRNSAQSLRRNKIDFVAHKYLRGSFLIEDRFCAEFLRKLRTL